MAGQLLDDDDLREALVAEYLPPSTRAPHLSALFRAVLAGEHAIVGFRNADITRRVY